ncbi:hypothetical protein L226DRAFT_575909 [Lentinus tigrinus ALCF2SS1-7]|uniref:uncharacterized protein n=1 Tax=Lentinus tigrinus ALCF2SS1-7 TaxID=1328758 RepID=UPI00116619BA|nr:hypothetical protein L226DRAFT_575909 [Lentinus tigrinus ALCF2SS1-7]
MAPPLPNPTPEQVAEVQEVCNQLHWAYYARPAIGSRERAWWEFVYRLKMYRLSRLVQVAKYTQLPPLAIACIYQTNRVAVALHQDPQAKIGVNFEDIHPADCTEPNLQPGNQLRPLPYKPATNGQISILPFQNRYRDWWQEEAMQAMTANKPATTVDLSAGASQSTNATPAAGHDAAVFHPQHGLPSGHAGPHSAAAPASGRDPGSASAPRPQSRAPTNVAASAKGKERADVPMDTVQKAQSDSGKQSTVGKERGCSAAPGAGVRMRSATRDTPAESPTSVPLPGTRKASSRRRSVTPANSRKKARVDDDTAGEAPSGDEGDEDGTVPNKHVPPEPLFPAEDIPLQWRPYPEPCDRCKNRPCYYLPLFGAVCHKCKTDKQGCSHSMVPQKTPQAVSGYLAWRYCKQLSDPVRYGTPIFVPPRFATFSKDTIPTWFLEQVARRGSKPPPVDHGTTSGQKNTAPRRTKIPQRRRSPDRSESPGPGRSSRTSRAHSPSVPRGTDGRTEVPAMDDDEIVQIPIFDLTLDDDVPMDVDGERRHAAVSIPARLPADGDDRSEASSSRPMVDEAPATVLTENRDKVPAAKSWWRAKEAQLMPAQVVGSWRELPLAPRPTVDPFMLQGPITELARFRPTDLAHFVNIRTAASLPSASLSTATDIGTAPRDIRPQTPPAQVFHIGTATRRLLEGTISNTVRTTGTSRAFNDAVQTLHSLRDRLNTRREAYRTGVAFPDTSPIVLEEIVNQTLALVDDCSTIADSLEAVAGLCLGLHYTLEAAIPTTPALGISALAEMIETVDRLRGIFGQAQEKMQKLEDAQEPLWKEVKRVSELADSAREQCLAVPDICSRAVEPMLLGLHGAITTSVTAAVNSLTDPLHRILAALQDTMPIPPADLEALRLGIAAGIQAVVGDGTPAGILAELSNSINAISIQLKQIEDESAARRVAADAADTKDRQHTDIGTPLLIQSPENAATLAAITDRIDKLEARDAARRPIAEELEEYLASLGLSTTILEHLGTLVGARADEREGEINEDGTAMDLE